jgi:hypothetical protein
LAFTVNLALNLGKNVSEIGVGFLHGLDIVEPHVRPAR